MKRNIVFIFILFGIINSIYAQQNRETLAVLQLSAEDVNSQNNVNKLQGFITTELFKTNKFRLVERARLEDVMKELRFQTSNMSFRDIQRLGQTLGVRKIITGELIFSGAPGGTHMRAYTANVRMIDVQTGFIDISITSKTTFSTGDDGGSIAIANLAEDIVRQIMENY